ncbi:cbb3-type cytochrome oxidase maturation protein [Algoriphagus ratkowskyi]|uniref:Cbb3-type cytochrome oxidase assembly protein CcoS n=1 Tax=Algoriphagus ratkowskyi TaxID=57028 RepID=A0A2W7QYE8_9BACT|nr:cbb3-type cytochrome oxidase assembly protein CcoS [Algoriphagus ratkowskyi]PZX51050.1 cbb3-type cytochrome oxidase maturation protein [Algoriphagus ratkowskyi]TXD75840.1 cbb3-type cytochrome oxidase assembly protein CcoS [Algoriphagus ratkowskyi]
MEVIFLLIAISLLLAGSFLFLFFKAMKSGQFDDNYTPSVRILFENSTKKSTKKNQPTKPKSYE